MKLLFLIALTIKSSLAGGVLCDQNCPKNEIYSQCAGPNQPTCWNQTLFPTDCIPGCVCVGGYYRDPNTYACVELSKCPKKPSNIKVCPLNEVYDNCLGGCQKTCDTLNAVFKCRCIPGCICKSGYVRSQITGQCIPIGRCKVCPSGYKRNISTGKCEFNCRECPDNEYYSECGTACEASCKPQNLFCILLCKRGCFCNDGFVRDPNTGSCIPVNRCPKCKKNEVYTCGNPFCETNCSTLNDKCTINILRCEYKCYCQDGFVRDKNSNCIPIKNC